MSNKLQINCVPNNSLKSELIKKEWKNIERNLKTIKILERELNILENSNLVDIPVQNPSHPYYKRYTKTINLVKEFRNLVASNYKWKSIYQETLSESTS